jgi:translation initiation factor eIF-2B subunit alpha
MMGLQDELREAAELMTKNYHRMTQRSSSKIALQSGIELFLKYITRTFLESPNFDECREAVLERGERFQTMSLAARDRIANVACEFILPNITILTHGWSRVVAAILLEASKTKHFDVIILEGRPDASGAKAAQFYAQETNIPVTVIPDAAMAYILEKVDMVLVGAEGVVENGGIVNKIGTYALAACAATAGKPCYVAAESYKFARLYPLHQSDLPSQPEEYLHFVDTSGTPESAVDPEYRPVKLDESIQRLNPFVDFTPAKFITLLFTDLGVLTPSAVSDELIRLYQ